MKKLLLIFIAFFLYGTGHAQNAQTRNSAPTPKGMVSVTLEVGDPWGGGTTGYQLLLDPTATAHGNTSLMSLACGGDPTNAHDLFAYKIPENASPVCNTVVLNNSVTIQIPAGTYDYYIINLDPSYGIFLANSQTDIDEGNDFEFEEGKKYTFKAIASPENIELVIEDDTPPPPAMISVTLEAGDPWGDGTGYQLLLDATASLHGTAFPGGWMNGCDHPADAYDVYAYKIPENADPSCTSNNIIVNNSATIQVPAGIYDVFIASPIAGTAIYLAMGAYGSQDNFEFEAGKKYKFLLIGSSENATLVVEDDIPAAAPAAVSDLTLVPNASGALTAVISWKNPSTSSEGDPLAELTAVKIYENNGETPIHTISNPTQDGTDSYTATVSTAGEYYYRVVAENSIGATPASTETLWVGQDVPAAPGNVTLVKNANDAELSWTAPAAGLHEGYFTATGLVYDVYRMPAEVKVSSEQAGLSFSEEVANPGTFFYKVVAKNAVGEGGSANSTTESFCDIIASEFPWTEGFGGASLEASCWSITDGDLGGNTWEHTSPDPISMIQGHTGRGAVHAFSLGRADEGWLISPRIAIPETGFYALKFWSWSNNPNTPAYHGVWVSTTNNSTSSFTEFYSLTSEDITWDWENIERSLNAYAGDTIYIAFKYISNGTAADAWVVDDISITKVSAVDAAAVKLYGANTPMIGEPYLYKAMVKNEGGDPLTNYTVNLIDEDNNVLATNTTGATIATNTSAQIDLLWTPSTADVTSVRAVVEMPDDETTTNDTTPVLTVTVQAAADVYEGSIGTGTASLNNYQLPFNFYNETGVSQTLYFDHDLIAKSGFVFELEYFNNFTQAVSDKPIKIWMANTDLDKLDNWIPESEMTLVYDGNVSLPAGQNTITITLDFPYIYTGENLVIMTSRVMDNQIYPINNEFYFTNDNDFANRSLYYESRTTAFDWTQEGTHSNRYPNVVVKMTLESGSVSGTVTDEGEPVEGVLVEMVDSYLTCTTDAEGDFSFDFVAPGDYEFKVSKFGYTDNTSETITVTADNNSVANITITPISLYTVSGKVLNGSAEATEGIAGVQVTLSGYETYMATTDADGNYSIPDVYGGQSYSVEARLLGYQVYRGNVDVENNDVTFNPVLLATPYSVVNPTVASVGSDAVVSWDAPVAAESYILDDGSAELGFYTNPGREGWLGNKFIVPDKSGVLTSIDVYGYASGSLQIKPLTIDIFDETMTRVASSGTFMLPTNDWVNVPLNDIPYSEIFYAMVHWDAGQAATHFIGYDCNGSNANGHLDYYHTGTGEWGFMHDVSGELPGVFLVRANAKLGDGTKASISKDRNNVSVTPVVLGRDAFSFVKLAEPIDAESKYAAHKGTQKFTPNPVNYMVHRFAEGAPKSQWTNIGTTAETNYTDTDWSTLDEGVYQYAVTAIYAGDNMSDTVLTNIIGNQMEVSYTVNLTTNTGEPVTGAVLVLTNKNYADQAFTKTADATGTVVFPAVWKGEYDLSITKEYYDFYSVKGFNISDDSTSRNIQIIKTGTRIHGLKVDVDGANATFSWNNVAPGLEDFSDNFESQNFNAWDEVIKGNGENIVGNDSLFWYIRSGLAYGAYEGTYYAHCGWGNDVNTWLISPTISVVPGTTLSFAFVTSYIFNVYPRDNGDLMIKVSTDDGNTWTQIWREDDFGYFDSWQWHLVTLDLSGYTDQSIKIAFNMVGSSNDVMSIDAVEVRRPSVSPTPTFSGYTIYLDGVEKMAGVMNTEFLFENLAKGDYVAGVKSVYTGGESDIYTIPFTIGDVSVVEDLASDKDIEVYGSKNVVHIVNPNNIRLNSIQVIDVLGRVVYQTKANGSTSFSVNVRTGFYFVKTVSENGKVSTTKVYLTR